jgi:hypothetical protein
MSSSEYVGPTAVRATVLPARAAYLIAAESESGLRRAVREACTRWAGMTEPIIPVKPGGEIDPWSRQVVSLARADVAVNVDMHPDDASTAASDLGIDLVPLADIDKVGPGAFTTHPSTIGPAYLPIHIPYVIAREDCSLWEVGAGDLTAEHQDSLPWDELAVGRRPSDDGAARAQLDGRTLVERTCSQFNEHSTWGGPFAGPAIVWVMEPGSVSDCIYFWNLRVLRPLRVGNVPMLLLPVGRVQDWLNFPGQLAHTLERPDEFAPDVALCSSSLSEAELHETASLLELELYNGKPRVGHRTPAPTRKAPFTYLIGLDPREWLNFERSYGEIVDVEIQLFRDKTTVRFISPVTFHGGGRTLVHLSGAAFEGLPRRPVIADRIIHAGTWNHDELRVATHARNEYIFELHIPELPEVTDALLGTVTARHELSAKGKPGMAWLELTNISPLLQAGVFVAIRALTTPRSKELLRELRKLRADGAVDDELAEIAAHWGGRSERRYRSAEQLEPLIGANTSRVLERLCDADWGERGLQVICDTCGLTSFVVFSGTSGHATCPGCASSAKYETKSVLTVYYRLNSYLDLLSDQGVLPHLLTIAALKRNGKRSYFLPGVDVWFNADGTDQAEADIFGICDGKIIAGEVKTSASQFSPDQVVRDVSLSSRLQADMHVLAATDDIPEDVVRRARQECEASGLNLMILQKADLLPEG